MVILYILPAHCWIGPNDPVSFSRGTPRAPSRFGPDKRSLTIISIFSAWQQLSADDLSTWGSDDSEIRCYRSTQQWTYIVLPQVLRLYLPTKTPENFGSGRVETHDRANGAYPHIGA